MWNTLLTNLLRNIHRDLSLDNKYIVPTESLDMESYTYIMYKDIRVSINNGPISRWSYLEVKTN